MKKLLGLIAAVLVSVGLTGGIVAANSGSIDTTGPNSDNEVLFENETDIDVDNDTDVDAHVDTDQDADTGDADVKYNTTGGDATSGDAMNESEVTAELDIDNSSSSSAYADWGSSGDDDGEISNTGPGSWNSVHFNNSTDVDIDNTVDVDFDSDVHQDADSGDATVSGNTTGGNATSGSASNSSSTSFSLIVTN